MSYISLYRKWRPKIFDEVKGQEAVVTTLKNQIKTEKTGHAYLFTGTRGTGKTSVAKILAAAVNCENPKDGNPCLECESCKRIISGNDMNVREIDAASNNGVDNVREIREDVLYPPTGGNKKVYIIDEAHMLSAGAFNALLKTLEEPPDYVIFILATTEVNKLPVTILSRCQRYDFRRITTDTIKEQLVMLSREEGTDAEDEALEYIARKADGAMRDALSLFDRCVAFYSGKSITYDGVLKLLGSVDTDVFSDMFNAIHENDVTGCLKLLDNVISEGGVVSRFFTDFAEYLRNLMILSVSGDANADYILDTTKENLEKMKADAAKADVDTFSMYINVISESLSQMRNSAQQKTIAEMMLIKLTRPPINGEDAQAAALQRINALEKQIAQLSSGLEEMKSRGASVIPFQKPVKKDEADKEREKAEKYDKLVKAMPEDLKKVVGMWDVIAEEYKNRTGAPMLHTALVLLADDGKSIEVLLEGAWYDLSNGIDIKGSGKTYREILDELITEMTGGLEVPLTIKEVDDEKKYDNLDLRKKVTMEIVPDKGKEEV